MKSILKVYENLSGQSVNFQKSGVHYSANVRRDKHVELAGILRVHDDITKSNYPGLPELVGRSKNRMFGFEQENLRLAS